MVNARQSTLGWISKVNPSVFVYLLRKYFSFDYILDLCFPKNILHILFYSTQKTYCFKNAIKKMCYALSLNNMTALSTK